jgi:hypothetical protein
MYKRLIATAVVTMFAAPANAEWSSSVIGPDVFGNTKVIATTTGFNDGIAVQCDQKDDLFVAFLFRKKKFEPVTNTSAELLIQAADGGTPVKLSAVLKGWNDDFGGIVASGRTSEMVQVLRLIATAKSKINVGAVVRGNQISGTFAAQGSTAAMEKAIKSCKLESLEKKS